MIKYIKNNRIYLDIMQMKKIIINADDFGYSENNNIAVKNGYETGIITSTSLMANMNGFENAVNEILPAVPNLDLGFHFNIMEGKSLTNCDLLCDNNGFFKGSYLDLLINSRKNEYLNQIEKEFRAQIEKVLNKCKISHIDSHVHTHAIPAIFNLTVKLAEEYGIKFVRTQKENPYIAENKIFNEKFPVNIIKNILLNTFTLINMQKIKKSSICTNDYFIGVLYTGYMDEDAILEGLKRIKKDNSVTEIIFHPYYSETISAEKVNNYGEYLITQNSNFKKALEKSGFVLSSYSAG